MKSIYLNDGTNVLIFSKEDAFNTIKCYLSDDLAEYFKYLVDEAKEEFEINKRDYEELREEFDYLEEENSELIEKKLELENKVDELKLELKQLRQSLKRDRDCDDDDYLPF